MENYQEGDFNKNAVNQLINKDEYAIVAPLAQATHIVIDQKFDCPELLCCEIANQYKIYQSNSEFQYDENQQPIAVWDEESSFLCRCFCRMARSFKGELKIQDKKASLVEAPYKCHNPIPCCSCLCARPTIQVANQNNELIGSLQMPCWCFFKGWGNFDIMELRVLDKSGNLKYLIHSTCCQKSVCCLPLQCLGCEKIKYDIKNTAKQVVGNIYNIYSGCCKEVCTSADKFGVAFPDNDEPHNKLLLTQAAIWLDYLQYMA
ncbi:hypothetical protein PPERSA_03681 [Pseudocohnilembus persalinus]|uniref:Phospholipid scramblase n=1 Tax=Pseudocohnilembus persalinus TaxID=266149 RepID=A0A0V0QG32_PSEPJ|nr:hypothetical protein PPERSA_03681 [Pseudocohnilembus persalinus]|eukprot:KRX01177.1 hypothetical protein PPERSA_03681 [Pseudocohnilembus persalinus]